MAVEGTTEKKELTEEEFNDLLGSPAVTGSVIAPTEKDRTVFTNSLRENEIKVDAALSVEEKEKKIVELTEAEKALSIELENEGAGVDETAEQKTAREKAEKEKIKVEASDTVKVLQKLIDNKTFVPFEGDTDISKYKEKDIEELILANYEQNKQESELAATKELFEILPDELQAINKYALDGGTNIKGELKRLLATLETRELDPAKEADQDVIITNWLTRTKFGTPEEIEQEVIDIRDQKKSEIKAKQFKPKMDAEDAEGLTKEAAKQAELKTKRAEATKAYAENIYKTLVKGELGGIKIGKKQQDMIFSGLTESQYPSLSGRLTTKLGHLLEKVQVTEPNYPLISKVLWLLEDEAGYEAALINKGAAATTTEVAKKLKQAQDSKESGANEGGSADDTGLEKRTLKRKSRSIFERT